MQAGPWDRVIMFTGFVGTPNVVGLLKHVLGSPESKPQIFTCMNADLPVFIVVEPCSVALWSYSPLIEISKIDASSEKCYFSTLKRWESSTWRRIEIICRDGCIECLHLSEFSSPTALPITINSDFAPTLWSPRLCLERVLVEYGESVNGSMADDIRTTEEGLTFQETSLGLQILEVMLPNGLALSLESSKVIVPHAPISLVKVNANAGLLAFPFSSSIVKIVSLLGAFPPKQFTLGDDRNIDSILWLSANVLMLSSGCEVFFCDFMIDSSLKLFYHFSGKPVQIVAVESYDVVLIIEEVEEDYLLYCFQMTYSVETHGAASRPCILKAGHKLMNLRVSDGLFSGSSIDEAKVISLQDLSFLWEVVNVPFETYLAGSSNGPVRLSATDATGSWIAVAGRYGFCICDLAARKWKLFEDPQEESDIIVMSMVWISMQSDSGSPLLAVIGMIASNLPRKELWILNPNRKIEKASFLHIQSITSNAVYHLGMPSIDCLSIITDDFILQIIKLSLHSDGRLSLSVAISASVVVFSKSIPDDRSWQVAYISPDNWVSPQHLLIIRRGSFLVYLAIPKESSAERIELEPTALDENFVTDFLIWNPLGDNRPWIVVWQPTQLSLYRWPFKPNTPNGIIKFPGGSPVGFYPDFANGLLVTLKNEFLERWKQQFMRISLKATRSMAPHLLIIFWANERESFDWALNAILPRNTQLSQLIMEAFYLELLSSGTDSFVGLIPFFMPHLETCLAALGNFLRRIEPSDASKIMKVLGGFGDLFALCYGECQNGANLVSQAWSLLKSYYLSEEPSKKSEDFIQMISISYQHRDFLHFTSAIELAISLDIDLASGMDKLQKMLFDSRDWLFLSRIPLVGQLQPTHDLTLNQRISAIFLNAPKLSLSSALLDALDRSDYPLNVDKSAVTIFLAEIVQDPVEAFLWSLIVEGVVHVDLWKHFLREYTQSELFSILNQLIILM